MSRVAAHVLDAASGTPAAGVGVSPDRRTEEGRREVDSHATDAGGRIAALGPDRLDCGVHRPALATGLSPFACSTRRGS